MTWRCVGHELITAAKIVDFGGIHTTREIFRSSAVLAEFGLGTNNVGQVAGVARTENHLRPITRARFFRW
jgi:hypothetical protein